MIIARGTVIIIIIHIIIIIIDVLRRFFDRERLTATQRIRIGRLLLLLILLYAGRCPVLNTFDRNGRAPARCLNNHYTDVL